jgi:spore coat protein U-like protein
MKAFTKSLVVATAIVSALSSVAATAAIKVSDSNTAVFNIGGTIDAMCKVNSTGHANASSLVLDQNNATQEIGVLEVWCNTGDNATTKYSSANNGFLVSGDDKIAYTLDVGNFASAVDLATDYTADTTAAGTDKNGSAESHTLKITPQSTGLDAAGDYADTITVTVSYN